MKFNIELRFEDIPRTYKPDTGLIWVKGEKEAVVLGVHEYNGRLEMFVASFAPHQMPEGEQWCCTNGSSYPLNQAEKGWELFREIVEEIDSQAAGAELTL